MIQNKNDSINSSFILKKLNKLKFNCSIIVLLTTIVVFVFPTSRFPHLILCPRSCKWKVATTYLAIRTKNN